MLQKPQGNRRQNKKRKIRINLHNLFCRHNLQWQILLSLVDTHIVICRNIWWCSLAHILNVHVQYFLLILCLWQCSSLKHAFMHPTMAFMWWSKTSMLRVFSKFQCYVDRDGDVINQSHSEFEYYNPHL